MPQAIVAGPRLVIALEPKRVAGVARPLGVTVAVAVLPFSALGVYARRVDLLVAQRAFLYVLGEAAILGVLLLSLVLAYA